MKNLTMPIIKALVSAILGITLISLPAFAYQLDGGEKVEGEASLGTISETLVVGRTLSVGLQEGQTWVIRGNSNPNVVLATVKPSAVELSGLKTGLASVKVCGTGNVDCLNISVVVQNPPAPSGNVLGVTDLKNGQLVANGRTVYQIYKNTKAGFTSLQAFQKHQFKQANITKVNTDSLPDTGYLITGSESAHPWGSWIREGRTVYFVHELGLIPITDYQTFLNNGGQDSLVVPANSADIERPKLSFMVLDDRRLK